tara:strand:+ start:1340 stop:1687 length:348 start_codon:yes stop_codon:yes gene_type:complete
MYRALEDLLMKLASQKLDDLSESEQLHMFHMVDVLSKFCVIKKRGPELLQQCVSLLVQLSKYQSLSKKLPRLLEDLIASSSAVEEAILLYEAAAGAFSHCYRIPNFEVAKVKRKL